MPFASIMIVFLVLVSTVSSIDCGNYGKPTNITGVRYTCQEEEVTKEQYEERVETQPCAEEDVISEACVCPADFYGEFCQVRRKIECLLEMISPSQNSCPSAQDYNPQLQGYPKCTFKDFSSQLQIEVLASCRTLTEGPYIDQNYLKYSELNSSDVTSNFTFEYQIDTGEIISSDALVAESNVKFFNFNKLSDNSAVFTSSLGTEPILGNELIVSLIDLSKLSKNFMVGGRTYFEFKLTGSNIQSQVLRKAIDQEGYEEPGTSQETNYVLIVVLVILGVLLLGGMGLFGFLKYKKYQKKKLHST